jgi:hypothetical protein
LILLNAPSTAIVVEGMVEGRRRHVREAEVAGNRGATVERSFGPVDGAIAFSQFVHASLRGVVHAADSPIAKALAAVAASLEKAALVSGAIGEGKDF